MGHRLHAVLGSRAAVTEFASRWVLARVVGLRHGFAMVPLTAALHDDIEELANLRANRPFPGFDRLSAGVELSLRDDVSRVRPVGYIETDYFGGVGRQRAVAWRDGQILAGPFFSSTEWRDGGPQTEPLGPRAIHRMLSALGVFPPEGVDHFDALALGRYRDTEATASGQHSD